MKKIAIFLVIAILSIQTALACEFLDSYSEVYDPEKGYVFQYSACFEATGTQETGHESPMDCWGSGNRWSTAYRCTDGTGSIDAITSTPASGPNTSWTYGMGGYSSGVITIPYYPGGGNGGGPLE